MAKKGLKLPHSGFELPARCPINFTKISVNFNNTERKRKFLEIIFFRPFFKFWYTIKSKNNVKYIYHVFIKRYFLNLWLFRKVQNFKLKFPLKFIEPEWMIKLSKRVNHSCLEYPLSDTKKLILWAASKQNSKIESFFANVTCSQVFKSIQLWQFFLTFELTSQIP